MWEKFSQFYIEDSFREINSFLKSGNAHCGKTLTRIFREINYLVTLAKRYRCFHEIFVKFPFCEMRFEDTIITEKLIPSNQHFYESNEVLQNWFHRKLGVIAFPQCDTLANLLSRAKIFRETVFHFFANLLFKNVCFQGFK